MFLDWVEARDHQSVEMGAVERIKARRVDDLESAMLGTIGAGMLGEDPSTHQMRSPHTGESSEQDGQAPANAGLHARPHLLSRLFYDYFFFAIFMPIRNVQ